MSCASFTIPDNNIPLQTISYIGGLLGIDIFRDTIPRLIMNPGGGCTPTFDDVFASVIDAVFTAVSLFYTLNLLFPGTMSFFSEKLSYKGAIGVLNGYVSLGQLIYLWFPIITVFVMYSIRKTDPDGKDEGIQYDMSWLIMIILVSLFGLLLLVVFGGGTAGSFMKGSSLTITDTVIFVIGVIALSSFAKFILPIILLLLGPGSIPAMFGQSFLSFCV